MNLLHFMWISYSFIVSFSGLNFLYIKNLPSFLKQLYAFGKVQESVQRRENLLKIIEVPKRYFSHFYLFASFYIPSITAVVILKYFGYCSCCFLNKFLDVFSSPHRNLEGTAVDPESVLIVAILVSFQVVRRCYECLYVSSYSNSKMNILHYIVGLTFYFGVGLSLIHDAPGFASNCSPILKVYITGKWFLFRHMVGVILFVAAFFLQFESHKGLAALRRKDGQVVSLGHFMPTGGGFEYVSCPHYFSEIVMYCSACIVLGGKSYTWWLVCLWTVTNQVFTGLTSHRWYREKFKDYPSKRSAIIPFLL